MIMLGWPLTFYVKDKFDSLPICMGKLLHTNFALGAVGFAFALKNAVLVAQ